MTLDIIVPVYGAKNYLEKAIKSLLTNKDAHIIMIDDGSTDGSAELADRLAEKSGGRATVFHQENKGVSAARNKGLELATADCIAFADCDDFTNAGYYTRLLDELEKKGADLAIGKYIKQYENGEKQNIDEPGFDCISESFDDFSLYIAPYNKDAVMGAVWRCVFKREIIENNVLRFNEKIHLSEDLYFLLNYLNCCKSVCTVNDYGYYYCIHGNSASAESYKKHLFENRCECVSELKAAVDANSYMSKKQKKTILERTQYTFAYECISNEMRLGKNGAEAIKGYIKQGFYESLLTDGSIACAQAECGTKKLPLVLKLCRAGKVNAIKLLYCIKK